MLDIHKWQTMRSAPSRLIIISSVHVCYVLLLHALRSLPALHVQPLMLLLLCAKAAEWKERKERCMVLAIKNEKCFARSKQQRSVSKVEQKSFFLINDFLLDLIYFLIICLHYLI
jgi:hypothetical protein